MMLLFEIIMWMVAVSLTFTIVGFIADFFESWSNFNKSTVRICSRSGHADFDSFKKQFVLYHWKVAETGSLFTENQKSKATSGILFFEEVGMTFPKAIDYFRYRSFIKKSSKIGYKTFNTAYIEQVHKTESQ